MRGRGEREREALRVLAIGALPVALYLRVIGYPFVFLDDTVYVTANSVVQRGLTLRGVSWAFRSFEATNWHPLTWLSHMADVELFGMWAGGHAPDERGAARGQRRVAVPGAAPDDGGGVPERPGGRTVRGPPAFKSANDAVDLALAAKRIDPAVPWVKSNVVAALIAPYATKSEGLAKIEETLRASYAGQAKLEELVSAALLIYRNNFFPAMKADWRAYPNNIGHKDFPGCFRCHDGQHKSSEGGSIKANDCNACHTILAQGNGAELEKISSTGHSFFHIDSINEDPSCTQCHTGAFPKE